MFILRILTSKKKTEHIYVLFILMNNHVTADSRNMRLFPVVSSNGYWKKQLLRYFPFINQCNITH